MLFYDNLEEFIAQQSAQLQSLKRANIPEVGGVLEVLGPNRDQDRKSNPGGHLSSSSPTPSTIVAFSAASNIRSKGRSL